MKGKTDAELIAEGGIEIELMNEKLVLFFNYRAFREFEHELAKAGFEKNLLQLLTEWYSNLSLPVTVVIMGLYAGLYHYGRWQSVDDLGDEILNASTSGEWMLQAQILADAVDRAMARVMPKADETVPLAKEATAAKTTKRASTGKKN